jgi:lactoylglutathione lyase
MHKSGIMMACFTSIPIIGGEYNMYFKMAHNNLNVLDLEKSLKFYEEALGLRVSKKSDNDSFTIVFLDDSMGQHKLELTYLKDKKTAYNLGDNEIHLAFTTDDYEGAYKKHKEMGCICYENNEMNLYFIADPDGYWLEILSEDR